MIVDSRNVVAVEMHELITRDMPGVAPGRGDIRGKTLHMKVLNKFNLRRIVGETSHHQQKLPSLHDRLCSHTERRRKAALNIDGYKGIGTPVDLQDGLAKAMKQCS